MPLSDFLPTLESVLADREERWHRRAELAHGNTVVSVTLRLPFAQRPCYPDILNEALSPLQAIGLTFETSLTTSDGPVFLFLTKSSAESIKRKTVLLEEQLPIGRFLDIDVSNEKGAVSRQNLGLPPRTCLVCGSPAWTCIKFRRHTNEEITSCLEKVLYPVGTTSGAQISRCASLAAQDELRLLYKPGLVTPITNGCHQDLNFSLMWNCLRHLESFWSFCVECGMNTEEASPEFLARLRQAGIEAEKIMFAVSSGVNTYRGLLYLLGILCAAVGFAYERHQGTEGVFAAARSMAADELNRDPYTRTRAKDLGFSYYAGARGEAASGFKTVQGALKFLSERKLKSPSRADALTDTLTYLIWHTYDTNVLGRGGSDGLYFMQGSAYNTIEAGGLLTEEGTELYRRLLLGTLHRNLSPGGAADLLICTVFLDRITPLLGEKSL